MDETAAQANKRLVIEHFNDFVNKRDLDAIDRNMTVDFIDHDGPDGKVVGIKEDRAMMARMHALIPDLAVEVKDALAENDRVVVRNVWTGTDPRSGVAMEFHGFVLWRLVDGKIVERWATVTPFHSLAREGLTW
jgi:predicted ester cyclase